MSQLFSAVSVECYWRRQPRLKNNRTRNERSAAPVAQQKTLAVQTQVTVHPVSALIFKLLNGFNKLNVLCPLCCFGRGLVMRTVSVGNTVFIFTFRQQAKWALALVTAKASKKTTTTA